MRILKKLSYSLFLEMLVDKYQLKQQKIFNI